LIPWLSASPSAAAALTLARGGRLEKRASRAKDKEQRDSPELGVPPEPPAGEADEDGGESRPASTLDMWFREAEIIARNLKESGTRR
jgi:hypothetical protein